VSLRGTREVKNNCQIIRLTGLLDAFSEPTVRKVLGDLIDKLIAIAQEQKGTPPDPVILDLSNIDFIDSSGLGALVQIAKKIKEAGGTLQIVTNTRVTQTLKLVRLDKFLSLHNSLELALENINQD
jgi:anti-anti-sigma factor